MQHFHEFLNTVSLVATETRTHLYNQCLEFDIRVDEVVNNYYTVIKVTTNGCELFLAIDRTPHFCWSMNGTNKFSTIEAGEITKETTLETILKKFTKLVHSEIPTSQLVRLKTLKKV